VQAGIHVTLEQENLPANKPPGICDGHHRSAFSKERRIQPMSDAPHNEHRSQSVSGTTARSGISNGKSAVLRGWMPVRSIAKVAKRASKAVIDA